MGNVSLLFGTLILAGLWFGPLPEWARESFSAHMALHMGIVAVAAPFLSIGLAGRRLDPVRRWPSLFPPIPVSVIELIVVWAWHMPGLHHAARHSISGFAVEQGAFLLCGLLVWLSAFGGDREGREGRIGTGIAALLLTSMHMTLLGALLALTPRPLYLHHGQAGGAAALADQHLGGAIMLLIGGVSYMAGGLWLTSVLLRRRSHRREAVA